MTSNKDLMKRPFRTPLTLLEEGWDNLSEFFNPSGLSVSENDNDVFVEAQLPGLKQDDIEVKLDENILWITGEKKEEKSDKRYYQKASTSFSYKLALPKGVDTSKEPEASFENGELKVVFHKTPQEKKTKNIAIKKAR